MMCGFPIVDIRSIRSHMNFNGTPCQKQKRKLCKVPQIIYQVPNWTCSQARGEHGGACTPPEPYQTTYPQHEWVPCQGVTLLVKQLVPILMRTRASAHNPGDGNRCVLGVGVFFFFWWIGRYQGIVINMGLNLVSLGDREFTMWYFPLWGACGLVWFKHMFFFPFPGMPR